jgi:RNA-directed DNA polymerase
VPETSISVPTSTKLAWIASMARKDKSFRFTNLAHLLTIELLREAHRRVRRDGATGVDQMTAEEYDRNLEANIAALHARLREGRYHAPPVRRVRIPKGNGKTRPIGIPTFEDKIVQRAVAMILEPIYEADFQPCSYGFRPGLGAHRALNSLWHGITKMGGGWVLDVDLRDFFGSLDHEKLLDLVALRVGDGRILRLLGKWLNAGVVEKGNVSYPEKGTPQGGVISPLLANIFLHYVLDTWFEEQVRPRLRGPAELVRYADDLVIVCALQRDADRIAEVLPKRLARYGLEVNAEKTRTVRFLRPLRAEEKRDPANGTFDFLGFTHYWKRSYRRQWVLTRKTMSSRFSRAVKNVAEWCRRNRHERIEVQHQHLSRVVRGHYAYYGVRGNFRALSRFQYEVFLRWLKWLQRRSQRGYYRKEERIALALRWPIPQPTIGAFST